MAVSGKSLISTSKLVVWPLSSVRTGVTRLIVEIETAGGVKGWGETICLLDAIPADRPLTGVFHLAGVLDDATVGALTPEQLHAVLRVKAE